MRFCSAYMTNAATTTATGMTRPPRLTIRVDLPSDVLLHILRKHSSAKRFGSKQGRCDTDPRPVIGHCVCGVTVSRRGKPLPSPAVGLPGQGRPAWTDVVCRRTGQPARGSRCHCDVVRNTRMAARVMR